MSMSPSAGRNASTRANSPPIHPCGVTVEIVGTGRSDRGRSCEEHDVCGTVLQEDSVVRIRHMQIIGDTGKEESALAVYWISDGIDRCRVGFLPRHLMKQWQLYDGRIAQVVDVYEGSESPTKRRKNVRNCGCCEAVLIDSRDEEGATGSSDNRKRTCSEKNDSSAANKQQKQQE
ncbi:hypothetical protein MHU86_19078 [Fragilaria crotonensis]|nr:hypothetical protein MHU86_19078 [Fragilaria crotonensis]